jgi:hypothetical protein
MMLGRAIRDSSKKENKKQLTYVSYKRTVKLWVKISEAGEALGLHRRLLRLPHQLTLNKE